MFHYIYSVDRSVVSILHQAQINLVLLFQSHVSRALCELSAEKGLFLYVTKLQINLKLLKISQVSLNISFQSVEKCLNVALQDKDDILNTF